MTRWTSITCAAAVLFVASCGGGPKQAVTSSPVSEGTRADGDLSDWQDSLTRIDGESFSLAIRNDDESLFLVLRSLDRDATGQILVAGLTVWFDPAGGSDRAFGVQYPVGLMNTDAASRINSRSAQQDPAQVEALVESMRDEVVLLGRDSDEGRWAIQDVLAIDADFRFEDDRLTYELRVPLQQTAWNAYAIGAAPGAVIGVGLETPKIDMAAMRRGGGPPGGGGRPEAPERIQVWIQVPLHGGPASESAATDSEGS